MCVRRSAYRCSKPAARIGGVTPRRISAPLRWLALALPLIVVACGLIGRRTPVRTTPLPTGGRVVFLLAPGMTLADWQNTDDAPTLARLAAHAAIGVIPTRGRASTSIVSDPLREACELIGNGDRSATLQPGSLTLADLAASGRIAAACLADDRDAVRIGLFHQPFSSHYTHPLWRQTAAGAADGFRTDPDMFAKTVRAAASYLPGRKSLVVADFDDIYRVERHSAVPSADTTFARRDALHSLDRAVAGLNGMDAVLMIVSPVASREAESHGERLGPVAIILLSKRAGSTMFRPGLLTSPATRDTPGLIAATDVAATLAALLDLPAKSQRIGVGRPSVVLPGADLSRLDTSVARWAAQARRQKALVHIPWCLAALLGLATVLSLRSRTKPCRVGRALGPAVALYPLALLLAGAGLPPSSPVPVIYIAAAIPCLALLILLWFTSSGRRHVREALVTVAALTAITYLIDTTLLGGALNSRSPLAYSVVEAARFYGLGNEAAGLLIGAALAASFASGADWVTALLIGGAVAVTLAHPLLGAKAGGLIGALVGFSALLITARRPMEAGRQGRKSARVRSVGVAAAIVLLTAAYALWEASRPVGLRSHVGEAVAKAWEIGPSVLVSIAGRKAAMNGHLVISSPWAVLLAVEILISLLLWHRYRRGLAQAELSVVNALIAAAASLFLFDDAGVVAAATCLLFLPPLLLTAKRQESENDVAFEPLP